MSFITTPYQEDDPDRAATLSPAASRLHHQSSSSARSSASSLAAPERRKRLTGRRKRAGTSSSSVAASRSRAASETTVADDPSSVSPSSTFASASSLSSSNPSPPARRGILYRAATSVLTRISLRFASRSAAAHASGAVRLSREQLFFLFPLHQAVLGDPADVGANIRVHYSAALKPRWIWTRLFSGLTINEDVYIMLPEPDTEGWIAVAPIGPSLDNKTLRSIEGGDAAGEECITATAALAEHHEPRRKTEDATEGSLADPVAAGSTNSTTSRVEVSSATEGGVEETDPHFRHYWWLTTKLLAHELSHTAQCRAEGGLEPFLARYMGLWLDYRSWWRHPMEREAMRDEKKIRTLTSDRTFFYIWREEEGLMDSLGYPVELLWRFKDEPQPDRRRKTGRRRAGSGQRRAAQGDGEERRAGEKREASSEAVAGDRPEAAIDTAHPGPPAQSPPVERVEFSQAPPPPEIWGADWEPGPSIEAVTQEPSIGYIVQDTILTEDEDPPRYRTLRFQRGSIEIDSHERKFKAHLSAGGGAKRARWKAFGPQATIAANAVEGQYVPYGYVDDSDESSRGSD